MEMKSYVKSIIKRNPFLQAVARVAFHRKDRTFVDFINVMNINPYLVFVKEKENTKLKTVGDLSEYDSFACIIKEGTCNDGFFASVRWALDGLYFCDKFGGIPVVSFSDESMYTDNNVFNDSVNPFEYYFDKIGGSDIHELPQVLYNSRNRLLAERMNGKDSYFVSQRYIDEMADIMRKYLRFNSGVRSYVSKYLGSMNFNGKKLGVHIRGTDYRMGYKDHPVFLEAKDYYETINRAIEKYGFEKIFLATDDNDLLNDFIKYYGSNMVVFSKNVERGNSKVGVHADINSKKTPYYLGLDVIGDMCALSSCDGIVSGMSQVSLIARIYKKSKGEAFVYDRVISKGINMQGELYHNPKCN